MATNRTAPTQAKQARREEFNVCGRTIPPGSREMLEVSVSELYDGTPLPFRLAVVRGAAAGPTMFIMGALHGDELIGVEVARRLANAVEPEQLRGTLLLVPIANPFGFLHRTRYMPDRRDLNRSFPGSASGSSTARLAHFLTREIVSRCDFGIELHTAAARRRNLPQLRADLSRPELMRLAEAFGCPYVIDSKPPEKSLRGSVDPGRTAVLLFEVGEILRLDEEDVRVGVEGCLGVMRAAGMLPADGVRRGSPEMLRHRRWVRSAWGGLLIDRVPLGRRLRAGEPVAAVVRPPWGDRHDLPAPHDGVVIGLATSPLVNPGDAVCHLAW